MATSKLIATALAAIATASFGAAAITANTDAANSAPVLAETASAYDFESYIANSGGQDAVDECTGGLTDMTVVGDYIGKAYYPIHNYCGGRPILELEVGATVYIAEVGEFTVVATHDVLRGDNADALAELPGTVLIQTCHDEGDGMRVAALEAA